MKRHRLHLVSLLGLAVAMVGLIPQRAAADDDDPPGRVARLGFIRGNVSFEPAGTEDWVSAVINRPLTTGDKLWNDNDSFSELHLGSASIRLGSNTGFTFLNLTDNMTQVQLTEGTLNIRVRRLGDDETFEVDTPNLAFTLLRPGNYKVNVNEAGDATVVVVREGQGEVTGGGSAYTIHPEEVGTFNGTDQSTPTSKAGATRATISMNGAPSAIAASIIPFPRATSQTTSLVTRTSTNTAAGVLRRSTAPSGFRMLPS